MKKVKDLVDSVIDKNFESFDYDYLDGRGLDAAVLINAASSPPFGSPLRVVLVRNFDKMSTKNQEMTAKFIDSIPEFATLVLTCGELDGKDKQKKIFKTIFSHKGHDFEFKEPTPDMAMTMLKEKAKELKLEITDEATEYLIESVGCNIGILERELEKLAIYANNQKITEDDIAQLMGAGTLGTIADLPIKIAQGDLEGAFKLLHKLMLSKESEGTILFRIKDFFLKLNMAKTVNATSWVLTTKFRLSKKAAEILCQLAPQIAYDRLMNCLHYIYESEISLKSARMSKDIIMIDLVARLGAEIRGE